MGIVTILNIEENKSEYTYVNDNQANIKLKASIIEMCKILAAV